MKKILKYLKIASCCFALTGVIFGSIYSITGQKDFSRVLATTDTSPIVPRNEAYYTSFDELSSIHVGNTINLKHNYNLNNFVYANPTYYDTFGKIVNDTHQNVVIDITDQNTGIGFVFNGVNYTDLKYEREWDTFLTFKLYDADSGNWVMLMYYDSVYSDYIYIPNAPMYTALFNGDFTIEVLYSDEFSLNLYTWLAYYYSVYSPNYLTLELNYDLKSSIIPLFYDSSKPLIYNGAIFYSNWLLDEIGQTDLITYIDIFTGGIYANNTYYSSMRVGIGCVYYTTGSPYSYSSTTNSSEFIYSGNESYRGYYYIYDIQLMTIQTRNDVSISTPNIIYQPVHNLNSSQPSMNNIAFDYYFVNSAFQTLKVLYTSNGRINEPNSISYGNMLYYLGNVILYAPNYDTPVIPPTPFAFTQVFNWLNLAFVGLAPFFNFQIAQGISLGVILATPLVITIILFIIKLFKR